MVLYGRSEFVGSESRKSKNGNDYMVLRFDDITTGEQVSFYWDSRNVSNMHPSKLVRHSIYDLEFSYTFNTFDKRWQVNLINIVGLADQVEDE